MTTENATGNPSRPPFSWSRLIQRVAWRAGGVALILILVAALRCFYAFRDRNPSYAVRVDISQERSVAKPNPLRVGFARTKINPSIGDPKHPVWMAGFSQNRAATRLHDDLWAIATIIDDGYSRVGLVALDAIGFFHDDVVAVRRQLAADLKLDYAIVCSTHNHSTPDLMGLWGPSPFRTGINSDYRQQVIATAASTLAAAVSNLQPARLAIHEIPTPPAGLVTDSRKPEVYDADLRVLHFTNPTTGSTIGTVVGWADHPETVWSENTEITADFPGYLRDTLENGVKLDGNLVESGVGGIHLYINGAVGGLMTTKPTVTVRDPYLGQDFKPASHDKARALGRQLASRILPRLEDTNAPTLTSAPLGIRARTIELPLDNPGFLIAPVIGLTDRGFVRWKVLRTEVAVVTLASASLGCIPGEIYPEIVNGGIVSPPGGDFPGAPVEVPPIRDLLPGRTKFIVGLANDEIGYIIPKTEWDRKPPYLYNEKKAPYGEVNSVGPETAGIIHRAFRELQQTR